jgi:hypothetical protein
MIQKGEPLSKDDEYLIQWVSETKKQNIALANDVLGKLLTVSVAIIGGGVIFLNEKIEPVNNFV